MLTWFCGDLSAVCVVQPAVLFVGDRFESEPDFKLAKSMLLDIFRGKQVIYGTDSNTCIDSTFTVMM